MSLHASQEVFVVNEATWEGKGGWTHVPRLATHDLMGAAQAYLAQAHHRKQTVTGRGLRA